MSTQLGYESMREVIYTGGDIAAHLNSIFGDMAKHPTRGNADLIGGAVSCILDCFLALREAGLATGGAKRDRAFLSRPPALLCLDLNRALSNPDGTEAAQKVSLLVETVNTHRRRLQWTKTKREDTAQAVVQKIEIVGMPARETISAVTRNTDGEIVATTTVERDVAGRV